LASGFTPGWQGKDCTVCQGVWQFTVMTFGLCSAPATVERLMDTVLRGIMTHISYT
jgi:hypothetical protein